MTTYVAAVNHRCPCPPTPPEASRTTAVNQRRPRPPAPPEASCAVHLLLRGDHLDGRRLHGLMALHRRHPLPPSPLPPPRAAPLSPPASQGLRRRQDLRAPGSQAPRPRAPGGPGMEAHPQPRGPCRLPHSSPRPAARLQVAAAPRRPCSCCCPELPYLCCCR